MRLAKPACNSETSDDSLGEAREGRQDPNGEAGRQQQGVKDRPQHQVAGLGKIEGHERELGALKMSELDVQRRE
eukprot:11574844-Alexandrium_andersonii.AAC.1